METENKKLLIVDDDPRHLLSGRKVAISRGYEADVACDLEEALRMLGGNQYAGVITDLNFNEIGITARPHNPQNEGRDAIERIVRAAYFPDNTDFAEFAANEQIKTAFYTAASKSDLVQCGGNQSLEAKANPLFREELFRDTSSNEVVEAMIKIADATSPDSIVVNIAGYGGSDSPCTDEVRRNIKRAIYDSRTGGIAAGYGVIKDAKRKGANVVAISSLSHGDHCIPSLVATGLVPVEEILTHARRDNIHFKINYDADPREEFYRLCGDKSTFTSGLLAREMNDPEQATTEEYRTMLKNSVEGGWIRSKYNLVFGKAILLRLASKNETMYNLSIDQLEGRIDQTRPYALNVLNNEQTIHNNQENR